jgi:peptidoglycan/LPS O-acetylase OafA/YrhL
VAGNRIKSLDSLRGIASLIVVIFHCLLSYNLFYYAYKNVYENNFVKMMSVTPLHTFWAGKEAVLLFFILSGFVLSIPFFNNMAPQYSKFITKRIFRIYGPYIAVMFVSTLLVMLFADFKDVSGLSQTYSERWDHDVTLKAIISYILMIEHDKANVNGVIWTLFHEMRISFIFPFFLLLLVKFDFVKSLFITVSINVFFFLMITLLLKVIENEYLLFFVLSIRETFYYCTFFIFGALLYKYKNKFDRLESLNKSLKTLLLLLSLVLINCKWFVVLTGISNTRLEDIISAMGILLLFSLVLTSKTLDTALNSPPLLWLGKVSYSLYLVHIPVLMLTTIFLSKIIPLSYTFVLVPIFSLVVAHFCYKYIEKPFSILGSKLAGNIASKKEK